MSYGKPKIKQSSDLTTMPKTMQNQLYNTHPIANRTYKIKENIESNVSIINASKDLHILLQNQTSKAKILFKIAILTN